MFAAELGVYEDTYQRDRSGRTWYRNNVRRVICQGHPRYAAIMRRNFFLGTESVPRRDHTSRSHKLHPVAGKIFPGGLLEHSPMSRITIIQCNGCGKRLRSTGTVHADVICTVWGGKCRAMTPTTAPSVPQPLASMRDPRRNPEGIPMPRCLLKEGGAYG